MHARSIGPYSLITQQPLGGKAPNAHKTLGTYPEGTLRFSFGPENTKQELDIALDALSALL